MVIKSLRCRRAEVATPAILFETFHANQGDTVYQDGNKRKLANSGTTFAG